ISGAARHAFATHSHAAGSRAHSHAAAAGNASTSKTHAAAKLAAWAGRTAEAARSHAIRASAGLLFQKLSRACLLQLLPEKCPLLLMLFRQLGGSILVGKSNRLQLIAVLNHHVRFNAAANQFRLEIGNEQNFGIAPPGVFGGAGDMPGAVRVE